MSAKRQILDWAEEHLLSRADGGELVDVASVHIPAPSQNDIIPAELADLDDFHPGVKVSAGPWVNCAESLAGGFALGPVSRLRIRSCAPFINGNSPSHDSFCSWGGRAAVTFLNSIIGARSNPASFTDALASAVSGKVPSGGLMDDDGRRAEIRVDLSSLADMDPSTLGLLLAERLDGRRARLTGLDYGMGDMLSFSLALNHDRRQPMFLMGDGDEERLELNPVLGHEWGPALPSDAIVVLGCPHLSEQRINKIARSLAGHSPSGLPLLLYSSTLCWDRSPRPEALLQRHGTIRRDYCPLADIDAFRGGTVISDSMALVEMMETRGVKALYRPSQLILEALTK